MGIGILGSPTIRAFIAALQAGEEPEPLSNGEIGFVLGLCMGMESRMVRMEHLLRDIAMEHCIELPDGLAERIRRELSVQD